MKRQRGGTLAILTFGAVALLGISGLVLDSGVLFVLRTKLQAAADSAALAGAATLDRGEAAAGAEARSYAEINGYAAPESAVTFPSANSIQVLLTANPSLLLGAFTGLQTSQVQASGSAQRVDQAIPGSRPWGLPDSDFVAGGTFTLKAGPKSGQYGNFRGLAIDGTGADLYREAILHGSTNPVAVGAQLSTEPGNMAGPTEDAVDALIAETACAVHDLVGPDGDAYDYAILHPEDCPRMVTVVLLDPVTFYEASGQSLVTATGFARFYISGTSGNGEVYGRFFDRLPDQQIGGTRIRHAGRLIE